MKWFQLLLVTLGSWCLAAHPLPTFFRRVSNGKVLDRRLPEFDEEIQKPLKQNILSADAGAKLNVLPNPVKNGGFVTIIWQDIRFPTPKDFIAYYCPFDDDPNHYIDFFHVTESLTWKKGYGHYKVQVYNMRSECIFKYYRRTPSNSQLVVSSQKLAFVGGSAAPLQGHLAMTERPTEMRVMWNSGEVNAASLVKYGLTPQMESTQYDVNIRTYDASEMCNDPANSTGFWPPGYMYDVF